MRARRVGFVAIREDEKAWHMPLREAVTAVTLSLLKRTGDAILIPTTASAIGSLTCYRLHASECDHVLAKEVLASGGSRRPGRIRCSLRGRTRRRALDSA